MQRQPDEIAHALQTRFGSGEQSSIPAGTAELAAAVLGRRSHRRYTDRPVADELIALIVRAALSASSKSDFQQVGILEVTDAAKRRDLATPFPAMPWIGTAPRFLVFLGDARRLEHIGKMWGLPQSNGGLEGFFNATVDAALALQTAILCAEDAGLGCCPISVIRNEAPLVGEILELPPLVFPVAGLCLGWPSDEGHVSMRLPPAVTLHAERYDDSRSAEDIESYDAERESRHPTSAERQRAVGLYGVSENYGWSVDKARQAANPEGEKFPLWLHRQGFRFD